MRKLIAAINMTLDGFCDHTAVIADYELHQHYTELMSNAGTLLYGRTTYQFMESYRQDIVKNPTGNKPANEFAELIYNIPKIVFFRTLKKENVDWKNSALKNEVIKEEILELIQPLSGKSIFKDSIDDNPAGGVKHIAYSTPVENPDKVFSDFEIKGFSVISSFDTPIAKIVFFDTQEETGVFKEMMGITKEGEKAVQDMKINMAQQ